MVFLQHLIEVKRVLAAESKGAHPGKVVLLGSLGLDMFGVAFHAHPPKGELGSH
jgi:hypothetical protein